MLSKTLASAICWGMLSCDFLHQLEIWALCSIEHPFQKSVKSLHIYPESSREKTKTLPSENRDGGLGVDS